MKVARIRGERAAGREKKEEEKKEKRGRSGARVKWKGRFAGKGDKRRVASKKSEAGGSGGCLG